MAAITPDGESASWLQQKQNVARILDAFLAQDTEGLASSWVLLSSSVLCARPVYERIAHFLVHVYVIPVGVKNTGLPLACQSVLNYLGSALNLAAKKFLVGGAQPWIQEFFFCLEPKSGSDSAKWLQKLKKKIVKITFERAVKLGEQLDNSESAQCRSILPPFAFLLTCVYLPLSAQLRCTSRTFASWCAPTLAPTPPRGW